MKLSQLVAKPQLVELTLDDSSLVEKYGETITFHTWDRQPMDVFMKLASATQGVNHSKIIELTKDLILDESGKSMLSGDEMLPTDVLMAAIGKITEMLGK